MQGKTGTATWQVELNGITKRFGGVVALNDVHVTFTPGQVHALMGQNGSGKSTLVKILAGVYEPDEGTINVGERSVHMHTPAQALAAGIAYVAQDPQLSPHLSVAENIMFGGRHPKTRWGTVDWRRTIEVAQKVLDELELDLDPRTPVHRLTPDMQRMVEVCRARTLDARVLILDEVTASLTDDEVERLFTLVRRLQKQGIVTIFISHRMDEIYTIADWATVLRDGQLVGSVPLPDTPRSELIRLMVGRKLEQLYHKAEVPIGVPVLTVENLSVDNVVHDVSLEVRAGEIVGLAGVIGSGRSELAEAICGIRQPSAGRLLVNGVELKPGSPTEAIRRGVCLVPADRRQQGLVLDMNVHENLMLPRSALGRPFQWTRGDEELQDTHRTIAELQVKTPHAFMRIGNLSGGNQQKVVLGRWLLQNPKLLVLDEPTNGVDVGAKAEIYMLMSRMLEQGTGILLISSELPELLALSDRVLVMYRGRIVREFGRGADQQEVAYYANGNV